MLHIVLYEPEIPPNTGNILRLAANTGCRLHLVKPLGFRLTDRALKRSGLDYADIRDVAVHEDWESLCRELPREKMWAATTRASMPHSAVHYAPGDVLLFGPETRGLPEPLLASLPAGRRIRIPMVAGSRSLNLSNAAAVVVYEAWRQNGYKGATETTAR